MEMPSNESLAWQRHMLEYPPGDYLTQRLLAELIMVVETFMCGFSGKSSNAKPRPLTAIAPWLDTPAVKARRERKSRESQMAVTQQLVQTQGDD